MTGVVGVVGKDHPLPVKHLEDGKFGQIGKGAVLKEDIRKENGVGSGFVDRAVDLPGSDEAAFHQVLDAVRRASAQDVEVGLGGLHPVNACRHLNLGEHVHRRISTQYGPDQFVLPTTNRCAGS